jgi:hypothetical protein
MHLLDNIKFYRRYNNPFHRINRHDISIYTIRLRNALKNKSRRPMCCYTFSLDYSIAKDFSTALEYYLKHKHNLHVRKKSETKELNDLLKMWKDYECDNFWFAPEKMPTTPSWFKKLQVKYDKQMDKMFALTRKYFTRLWY